MGNKAKIGLLEAFGNEKTQGRYAAQRAETALNTQEQMMVEMRSQTALLTDLLAEQRRGNELLSWFAARAHEQDQRPH